MKEHFENPPLLAKPIIGESLGLHLAMLECCTELRTYFEVPKIKVRKSYLLHGNRLDPFDNFEIDH